MEKLRMVWCSDYMEEYGMEHGTWGVVKSRCWLRGFVWGGYIKNRTLVEKNLFLLDIDWMVYYQSRQK
jgi:hypothetical protein